MADESSASVIPLHQVQPPKRKKAGPSAQRAKASRQRKKPSADKAEPPSSEHLIPLDFPHAEAEHAVSPGILRAFDANDVSKQLWNNQLNPRDAGGNYAKFAAPTIANGHVYLPTFSNSVVAYGLR